MKTLLRIPVLLLPVFMYCTGSQLSYTTIPAGPSPELRGIWITRFDWVRPSPTEMEKRIVDIIASAQEAGFNALFFQVRGQAETLYPSPLEPWAELLAAGDPGFDPLQFAITQAHSHGIQFHAYVNLLPLWNRSEPPKNPRHLFHLHGPQVSAESSWVCFGPDQKPMALDEYYYLNPALPQVKSYLKKVIGHLTSRYDIDGLHFDRIRYPSADRLYDPYSIAQFQSDSLQHPLSRPDWARAQLTNLVEAVVSEALLIKPYLQISCAAWGLYKTRDFPGYEQFNSGYDAYYQDTVLWLERGIMDFIVPMIYWDMEEPKPNLDEVWLDFKRRTPLYRNIIPGLSTRKEWFASGELARQIGFLRENGAAGHVLFSWSGLERSVAPKDFLHEFYAHTTTLPTCLDRHSDRTALALRTDSLNHTPIFSRCSTHGCDTLRQTADQQGWRNFVLPAVRDSLRLGSISFNLSDYQPPFRFSVSPVGLGRVSPWLEFREFPADTVERPVFHLLAKTAANSRAFIGDDSCHVYKTGVYFKKLSFQPGWNRYSSRVRSQDSSWSVYGRQVYVKSPAPARSALPLWVDKTSMEPKEDLWLTGQDHITFRCKGSKGQQAWVLAQPGKQKWPLLRTDHDDYAVYETEIELSQLKAGKKYHFNFLLSSPDQKSKLLEPAPVTCKLDKPSAFPRLRVTKDKAALSYNLGPIRLGGPLLAEYPAGVVLGSNGRIGHYYRIRLNATEEGYISEEDVETLPAGTVTPAFYITSLSTSVQPDCDLVTIPYLQPVAWALYPEPEQARIRLALYGVKTSSTWITHYRSLAVVDHLDWRQSDSETYEVLIYLQSRKIWGYTMTPRSGYLELKLMHPPALTVRNDSVQVKGLIVAIEAGHGGSNTGAVGLSGMEEKSLNLDVARLLEKMCADRGIHVVQIRADDRDMSLEAKRSSIEQSGAHLAVSIHANAGGTANGYLGASGTSVYHHNPFWRDFADLVYRRLLQLPLNEFGRVASFNYRVTRTSSRPAILVEQGFMSHALDEEKLADPMFRRQIAEKILQGILDFVSFQFDKPVY